MAIDQDKLMDFVNRFVGDLGATMAAGNIVVGHRLGYFRELFFNDLVAELNALVADIDAGPGNELAHLLLALAAERALEQIRALANPSHM